MDKMGDQSGNSLINELLQGRELARHLQICLSVPSTSETRVFLIQRIIVTFEKALAMLNWNSIGGSVTVGEPPKHPTGTGVMSESPPFSPRSEDSDKDFRDQDHNPSRNNRKTLAKWTKQIRVDPGMGVEAPLDDGFSWRKYGQKDILGAKFPRGYYRCTHRNVQGCLATKQVQRSDEDPSIFEITYRGNHTCTVASNLAHPPADPRQSQEQLVNLREGLRVLTHNLDASEHTSFASVLLPSSSTMKAEEKHEFLSPMVETSVAETFGSPPYMSPATSGTAQFSVSPRGVNSFGFGGHQNLATSGSHAISASSANSPTAGLEFPFDHFQFDGHNFTFDNSQFF